MSTALSLFIGLLPFLVVDTYYFSTTRLLPFSLQLTLVCLYSCFSSCTFDKSTLTTTSQSSFTKKVSPLDFSHTMFLRLLCFPDHVSVFLFLPLIIIKLIITLIMKGFILVISTNLVALTSHIHRLFLYYHNYLF